MPSPIQTYVKNRCPEILIAVHEAIAAEIASLALPPNATLLDVGCWTGDGSLRYAKDAGIAAKNISGIECMEPALSEAQKKITAKPCNLEADPFPFPDNAFDIVVCNQVFEHLKQIYLPMGELWRVLKPGGRLVFSVPNLASFHNRVLLLLGRQPTSIKVMGPHVRGFTAHATGEFLEFNGRFEILRRRGIGFYPFPEVITTPLCRLFPGASHTLIYVAQKASGGGPNWTEQMRLQDEQSNFFA